jgi:hypothetical protein
MDTPRPEVKHAAAPGSQDSAVSEDLSLLAGWTYVSQEELTDEDLEILVGGSTITLTDCPPEGLATFTKICGHAPKCFPVARWSC